MAERRLLRLPDVVDHRTRRADRSRLAAQSETIERRRPELFVKNARGVIGIEQPILHRRFRDAMIEARDFFF